MMILTRMMMARMMMKAASSTEISTTRLLGRQHGGQALIARFEMPARCPRNLLSLAIFHGQPIHGLRKFFGKNCRMKSMGNLGRPVAVTPLHGLGSEHHGQPVIGICAGFLWEDRLNSISCQACARNEFARFLRNRMEFHWLPNHGMQPCSRFS